MKEAPSLLQLIPDIFFDALAYLLPATLLFLGIMIIPSSIGAPLVNAYLNLGASFDRFVVILSGSDFSISSVSFSPTFLTM